MTSQNAASHLELCCLPMSRKRATGLQELCLINAQEKILSKGEKERGRDNPFAARSSRTDHTGHQMSQGGKKERGPLEPRTSAN